MGMSPPLLQNTFLRLSYLTKNDAMYKASDDWSRAAWRPFCIPSISSLTGKAVGSPASCDDMKPCCLQAAAVRNFLLS